MLHSAKLANIGYKESLKDISTAAEPGNAVVGQNVNYITNLSLRIEWISVSFYICKSVKYKTDLNSFKLKMS